MINRICYFLLFIFISNNLLAFQYSNLESKTQLNKVPYIQEVENIFPKVMDHFTNGRYELVDEALKSLLEIYPINHRITGILYILSRSQFEQGKYREASVNLQTLINNYKTSEYLYDALYLHSMIAFKQNRYLDASLSLLEILENKPSSISKTTILKNLSVLLVDYLDYENVQALRNRFISTENQSLFMLSDAIQTYRQGDVQNAILILDQVIPDIQDEELRDEFNKYLVAIKHTPHANLKIGVILPLSGFFAEEAKSLLRGIQFALNDNPIAKELEIELVIIDTQGETLLTIGLTTDLVENNNVIGIIGELESDKTAIIAKITERLAIPVIAPTAIESGLSDISNNLFQMAPDISIIGEKTAEFAFNSLDLRSFAILAPADKYGKNIADSFAQKVDQLNGTIVAETWYYEGATDLREYFSQFRTIGLRKMKSDSILFENPFYNRSEVDSVIKELKIIEAKEKENEGEKKIIKPSDSTATPVTSIDGIFLPVYTEQISYIAPQLTLFNIPSQLLGGNYWNDYDVLNDNDKYVDGAIFSTDIMIDETDSKYIRFRNDFRLAMATTPGKLEITGFDSMNFLLKGLQSTKNSRKQLLNRLKNIRSFDGIISRYIFKENQRVNTNLTFLKFQDNSIQKIDQK